MDNHLFGTGKIITLFSVQNVGIEICMIKELRNYGFTVISINEELNKKYLFHYPDIRSLLYGKYRKIIYKDKQPCKDAKNKFYWQKFFNIISKLSRKPDYALFLRGDIFDDKILKEVKKQTTNGIINYQYDGLSRYPEIFSKINLFDKFFLFDYQDLDKFPNLLPATNFYFEPHTPLSNNGKVYFLAAHQDGRTQLINQFTNYAKEHNLALDFNIYLFSDHQKNDYTTPQVINFFMAKKVKPVSFQDNILYSQQSAILADFVINKHKGLSFRVFEALGYQKKLITTNETVKLYDFYHPNNIFVYNGKNHDELTEFLKLPYFPIDENIRKKYSFANWIRYVLDIPPYQKITLPKY